MDSSPARYSWRPLGGKKSPRPRAEEEEEEEEEEDGSALVGGERVEVAVVGRFWRCRCAGIASSG